MNDKKIWDFLISKIHNPYGVAGLMGNLYAESVLNPKNLQTSYETKLKMTDTTYTNGVDNGTYTKFTSDRAGYGLAQWTNATRKKNLLNFAKEQGKSIGDLDMQLNFLWKELDDYSSVKETLLNATSIKEASDIVLTKFERPANQDDSVKTKRANYGKKYYDAYVNSKPSYTYADPDAAVEKSQEKLQNGKRIVITKNKVNKRIGDGTNFKSLGFVNKGDTFAFIATSTNGWHAIYTDDQICWVSPDFSKVEGDDA